MQHSFQDPALLPEDLLRGHIQAIDDYQAIDLCPLAATLPLDRFAECSLFSRKTEASFPHENP